MISQRELFYKYLGIPSTKPMGLEIDHAKGIFLYDMDGKEYIDLVSGVTVSNIGHLHPKVVEAVTDQLKKYMHLMVYGEYIQNPQVRLAKMLVDVLPSNLNSVYFVNSGSEANEGAMKLAKRFTRRTEIIAFKNAYHGGTHGALSVLGNESLKSAFRPLLPDIRFIEFNKFEDLTQITEKTACIMAETIQAEAGIILPENGFLAELRNRCNETGTLLVIDDVQMGFGRTGKLFSFENFGIVPDILTLAKGMGGGMPIGAFIASNEIMKTLSFEPELGHITTFGGHPVCCAAALANLNVIMNENLIDGVHKKGNIFKSYLTTHPLITEVRQAGLMLGSDLNGTETASKIIPVFLRNGLITDRFLFRNNAFRISPPLTITEFEIQKAIDLIHKSLDELK